VAPPHQFAGHPWASCAYEPKRRLGDTEVDFTQTLPYLKEASFLPQHANRFSKAGLLTRPLFAMVAARFNVAVVGHFRVQRSELYVLR
jgi:hypothetical protein